LAADHLTAIVEYETDLVVRKADFEIRLNSECTPDCPIATVDSGG
jgi:hypothetical protein